MGLCWSRVKMSFKQLLKNEVFKVCGCLFHYCLFCFCVTTQSHFLCSSASDIESLCVMWKASVGVEKKHIPTNVPDDDWETDPDFVNNVTEQEQRWGSKTIDGSGRTAGAIE